MKEDRNGHNWLVWNLANIVSLSRLLAPFILFYPEWSTERKLILYLILETTDIADGAIARAIGNREGIGKFIDPVVDKIMRGSGLVFLLTDKLIAYWIVAPIILGEMMIIIPIVYGIYFFTKKEIKENRKISLVELYGKIRNEIVSNLSVSAFGKMKALAYGMGFGFLLLDSFLLSRTIWVIYTALFISGFFFCAVAIKEYYEKFQKWQKNKSI